jgi:hypothetical protein
MTAAHRGSAPVGLVAASLALLAACGGGGGGGSGGSGSNSSADAHNFSVDSPNVVAMTIGNGPSGVQSAFNIPYASVTVCLPNSSTCGTITNLLVDTGSSGLRLIKSQIPAALACNNGAGLCPMADPNPSNVGNTIGECLPFADGYAWGAVSTAGVKIGGESAASVPIQIVDDSQPPSPAVPDSCAVGTDLNSVSAFDANGVLGVGLFVQDCGAGCTSANNPPPVYYTCSSSGQCTPTALAISDQVANPVASFAADNNGVILQLPAIAANGAATASGYLVFGIGTQSDNALQGATTLTTNDAGEFTASFDGNNSLNAFIDSGSNALFFPDSTLSTCQDAMQFYCPGSSTSLSATSLSAMNQGASGATSNVSFQVANLDYLADNDGSNFALADVAGTSSTSIGSSTSYFDWGLPFFYGRTVFIGIESEAAAPYFAY